MRTMKITVSNSFSNSSYVSPLDQVRDAMNNPNEAVKILSTNVCPITNTTTYTVEIGEIGNPADQTLMNNDPFSFNKL